MCKNNFNILQCFCHHFWKNYIRNLWKSHYFIKEMNAYFNSIHKGESWINLILSSFNLIIRIHVHVPIRFVIKEQNLDTSLCAKQKIHVINNWSIFDENVSYIITCCSYNFWGIIPTVRRGCLWIQSDTTFHCTQWVLTKYWMIDYWLLTH